MAGRLLADLLAAGEQVVLVPPASRPPRTPGQPGPGHQLLGSSRSSLADLKGHADGV